jgi:anti-anti-sigma factor
MTQGREAARPVTRESQRAGGHAACARRADGWQRRVPDGMVITVDPVHDRAAVRLVGDLDIASAPHVRWALPRLTGRILEVDLSRLAFMDAAGLSSLLLVRRQLERAGRRLRLHGARGQVRTVFDLSGLGHLVEEGAGPAAQSSSKVRCQTVADSSREVSSPALTARDHRKPWK